MLNCDAFEELHDIREEWIGDIRDDEAIHMAPAGAQSARMRIGIVAQRFDGAANLSLNDLANGNCSIDHPGYSGRGDPGFFCNLSNVHVWSGFAAFLARSWGRMRFLHLVQHHSQSPSWL